MACRHGLHGSAATTLADNPCQEASGKWMPCLWHLHESLPIFEQLQHDVAEIAAHDGLVMLAGDFNARTGEATDTLSPDIAADLLDDTLQPAACMPVPPRRSADAKVCAFGKSLLSLCMSSDLVIVNGRVQGDEMGAHTCHITQGSSLVDYFIVSSTLMAAVSSLTVLDHRLESDHCPLKLMLHLQAKQSQSAGKLPEVAKSDHQVNVQKIRYRADKVQLYREALRQLLEPVFSVPNPASCLATALQECIAQAAIAVFGRPSRHACPKVQQEWYDEECKMARASLKHFTPGTAEYATKGKAYKALLRRKRRAWQRHAQQSLCELAYRNPQAFWKQYKKKESERSDISQQEWKEAFEALYKASETSSTSAPQPPAEISTVNPIQTESPSPTPLPPNSSCDQPFDFLNADITREEVSAALKRLKRNKAAGVDGIKAEFILDASEMLLDPLVITFNQALEHGVPAAWCVGVIHPIFKAGDRKDPGNYRGITVVVILAKLYAMVLEARATAWAEHTKCRAKGQAGFRKDFRTTDQIFIIRTLVQQARHAKRKLYCCFVDFKKAFDLVPRDCLWKVLKQRGMAGRVLSSLQSMYAKDRSCVLTSKGATEMFECSIGVKQGCPASPLLFSLYLDELEALLCNAADETDCPHLAQLLLAILLFADDIALFSYSEKGLQRQLDILQDFCAARGLQVNVQKTKAMVFEPRKSHTSPLSYAGANIEQVDIFKYLGITMHGTRGFSTAIETLCQAAKRAMFGLLRRCQQLHIHDPIVKCKLFDSLVKPILCYGCEIWSVTGGKTALAELERTQIGFLKMLLGVQTHTKTLHVLAEFGRFPLQLSWHALASKYLERLEKMNADRMLKQAFIADCSLPARLSWRSLLEAQLEDHMVPSPTEDHPQHKSFSLQSAQRQHMEQLGLQTSSKSILYRSIKIGYGCEPYIQQSGNRHLRRIIAQFRTGSHWLNIETGRHKNLERADRTCPMCSHRIVNPGLAPENFDSFDSDDESSDPVDDEHHAIFECSGYGYARGLFPDLFQGHISTVSHFLNQPQCNRMAKFLTWIRILRMNKA